MVATFPLTRTNGEQPIRLIGNEHDNQPSGLHVHLPDDLTLVDTTGQIIRNDKRGAIDTSTDAILLGLHFP